MIESICNTVITALHYITLLNAMRCTSPHFVILSYFKIKVFYLVSLSHMCIASNSFSIYGFTTGVEQEEESLFCEHLKSMSKLEYG